MLLPPEILETDRLRIIRLRLSHAPRIFERWGQDPEVTRYLIWKPHESVEDAVDHATRCEKSWEEGSSFAWIMEEKDSGATLGSIAAHRDDHAIEIGYLLASDAQGHGYMTEAVLAVTEWFLAQPEVFRVGAVCDVDNGASARVLERAGFEFEAKLRRWILHPNISDEPRDVLSFVRAK